MGEGEFGTPVRGTTTAPTFPLTPTLSLGGRGKNLKRIVHKFTPRHSAVMTPLDTTAAYAHSLPARKP